LKPNLPDWLILAMWRAVLGEIYPAIRAITVNLSEGKELRIKYFLDRPPEDYDFNSIDIVAFNFAAMGLPEIEKITTECTYSPFHLAK
jgi:hypothetical protein